MKIIRAAGDPPFHTGMQCFVHRVEYDFDARAGLVVLDDGCTDWTGATNFFLAIDPDVLRIITVQLDGKPDTEYRRDPNGEWISLDHSRGQRA